MTRHWVKRGRVVPGETAFAWGRTHAMLPVAEVRDDDAVAVYFHSRDGDGRGHIGVGELTLESARWRVSAEPVLRPGSIGAFDESGVQPACLVADRDTRWLYYTGWTRGVTVPFYFYVGLALSHDQGRSFERYSPSPILERDQVDPFLTASPWVLIENGVWRMWYVSCVGWESIPTGRRHRYHIKYAESANGTDWRREGRVCIDFASPAEYAIARPCVRKQPDGRYHMWFCARGEQYRLGFAESADGLNWTRLDDQAGLDVSPEGWDSDMIAYPFVFEHGSRHYMLYNGNGYGRTGIGLAVLDNAG